jgi:uncharacterized protein (TIGR03663 family)
MGTFLKNKRFLMLFIALALAALLGAASWLRFSDLPRKPMHADESEQSYTLGKLLRGKGYRYDPKGHHGPTLYYLTAAVCKIAGKNSLSELTETNVRAVPAAFGIVLVVVPLLWWRRRQRQTETGNTSASFVSPVALGVAVALGATSPTAVYYARYFVQETIFVACFWAALPLLWRALAAGRSSPVRRGVCAALAGLAFGVAVASKETWVLMAAAAGAGGIAVAALHWKTSLAGVAALKTNFRAGLPAVRLWLIFALAAAVVAAAFFSSFGKNPAGVWDSVTTYFTYKDKAFNDPHGKAFGWYFSTFFFPVQIGKWSFVLETAALCFAVVAAGCVCWKSLWRGQERSVALFSLVSGAVLFLLYSLISYKTPWLMLGVLPPLWLASGLGLVAVSRFALAEKGSIGRTLAAARWALVALLWATVAFFAGSQWRSAVLFTDRFSSDERNPLAYVHTNSDVKTVEEQAARIARFVAPDVLFARVHSAEYAPLLWYLRAYEGRVGFWNNVPAGDLDAPVIITDASTEALVAPRLKEKYIVEPIGLRPGVLLTLRLREDLLNKALAEE